MRTLLLLLTLSLFACSYGQTYTYHNYPDSTISWYGARISCIHGSCGSYPFINIIKEETFINGHVFYKVNQQINSPSVVGYIRQDSAKTLHCFYVNPYDGWHEAPFCNFTLNPGDSLVSGLYTFHIAHVDTLIYNGVPRRTLSVTTSYIHQGNSFTENDKWIDGIGSLLSPIGIYGRIPITLQYSGYNICKIQEKGTVLYENNGEDNCRYFDTAESLSVYPNPTSDYMYLRIPNGVTLRALEVYSILGALEKELNLEPSYNSEHYLNISDLAFGVHYLQVIEESGKSTVLKFIVARNN